MNKLILILCSAVCIISSCKKGSEPDGQPEKKYTLSLNVSDFNIASDDFGAKKSGAKISGDSLKQYATYLLFNVYSTTGGGSLVYSHLQTAEDANFGNDSISLPSGNYNVVVYASKHWADDGYVDLIRGYVPGFDAFYARREVRVENNVNAEVVLERIVARIKIVLNEEIPLGVKRMRFEVLDYPWRDPYPEGPCCRYIDNTLPNTLVLKDASIREDPEYNAIMSGFVNVPQDSVVTSLAMQSYVFAPQPRKTVIRLVAKDSITNQEFEKFISDVPLQPNRTTVLTGKLFTGVSEPDGVSPVINNPDWRLDTAIAF